MCQITTTQTANPSYRGDVSWLLWRRTQSQTQRQHHQKLAHRGSTLCQCVAALWEKRTRHTHTHTHSTCQSTVMECYSTVLNALCVCVSVWVVPKLVHCCHVNTNTNLAYTMRLTNCPNKNVYAFCHSVQQNASKHKSLQYLNTWTRHLPISNVLQLSLPVVTTHLQMKIEYNGICCLILNKNIRAQAGSY